MPEDAPEIKETIPPAPPQPPIREGPEDPTKRRTLKLLGGFLASLPFLGRTSPAEAAQIEPPEIPGDEIAERYAKLRKRIRESSLGKWDKYRFVEYAYYGEKADRNFRILTQEDKTKPLAEIVRKRFRNPDFVNPYHQIFFSNHYTDFGWAVAGLEAIDWENAEAENLISEVEDVLSTRADGARNLPQLPYFELLRLYANIGTKSGPGTIVSVVDVPSDVAEPMLERQKEALALLPLPDISLKVEIRERPEERAQRGYFVYRFGGTPLIDLYLPQKEDLEPSQVENETIFLSHEVGHAIDIWANPSLILFMAPEEIIEIETLRQEAALSAGLTDREIAFRPRILNGEFVVYSDLLVEKSREGKILKEELEIATRNYPFAKMGAVFNEQVKDEGEERQSLFNKLLEQERQEIEKRYPVLSGGNIIYSWDKFFDEFGQELSELRAKNPLLDFIAAEIKTGKMSSFLSFDITGAPPAAWWSEFFWGSGTFVTIRDLIQKGELKSVIDETTYRQLIEEALTAWYAGEKEILAQKFAAFVFLKHNRGDELGQFEGDPYLRYLRRISEILGKKGVVLRIDEGAIAKIRQHGQEGATV